MNNNNNAFQKKRIRPCPSNPRYFEYNGKPVVVLGETTNDTSGELFSGWAPISNPSYDFSAMLKKLHGYGGSLVRCIPYFPGPFHTVQPFEKQASGLYDLEKENFVWADRLRSYLDVTLQLDIVVSLEIWENWSFCNMDRNGAGWLFSPWHPANNVNYDENAICGETSKEVCAFYQTVPETHERSVALRLQKIYVSRLLDIAWKYPNVVYNLHNESEAPLSWAWYWADHIHAYGEEKGVRLMVGDMPGSFTGKSDPFEMIMDDHFDFLDIGQFTDVAGLIHGGDMRAIAARTREYVSGLLFSGNGKPKPLIATKMYARCIENLWSKIGSGVTGARFHRIVENAPWLNEINFLGDNGWDPVAHAARFIAAAQLHTTRPVHHHIRSTDGVGFVLKGPAHVIVIILGHTLQGSPNVLLSPGVYTGTWLEIRKGQYLSDVTLTIDNQWFVGISLPKGVSDAAIILKKNERTRTHVQD